MRDSNLANCSIAVITDSTRIKGLLTTHLFISSPAFIILLRTRAREYVSLHRQRRESCGRSGLHTESAASYVSPL